MLCQSGGWQNEQGPRPMITEIVLFDLPKGITREEMIAQFRESIPRWQPPSPQ